MAGERKQLGIPSPGGGGENTHEFGKAGNPSKLNEFKKEANKCKCQVAALKKRVAKFKGEGDDDDKEPPEQDAGDQFGGRASKKGRKSG